MAGRLSSGPRSDPASEEPRAADATASFEPDTPDVFLSYSRKDQPFALRLASALEADGWDVWIDTQDVPPASEWREELAAGIRSAHTFVFLLSPASAESDYCRWELRQAVELGKRLVPLVIQDVDAAPEELASRQYVFMREEDDFEQALQTLTTALRTDLDWVRDHRHWLLEALRWESEDRDRSLLLRGRELKAAEAWLARQAERTEPRPTPLQAEFLLASRAWESRRIRMIAAGTAVALTVAVVLGVLALLQRNDARKQAAIALSRELSLSSTSQLTVDPQRSLLLAIEAVEARPTAEADNALRRAVLAARQRAEIPTRSKRIGALINAVAFSPDGSLVAGASKDGTISVAPATGPRGAQAVVLPVAPPSADDLCTSLTGGGSEPVSIAFSSDGRLIATATNQGWIEVWRWPQPRQPVTSPFCLGRTSTPSPLELATAVLGSQGPIPAAVTFARNDLVEMVQNDGQLLRWPWASGAKPVLLRLSRMPVVAAAFSASAAKIALADAVGVSITTSRGRRLFGAPLPGAQAIVVSADGSRLAAANGRVVTVWSRGLTRPPVVLRNADVVRSIAMSRDGELVAIGDETNVVRVWDLSRGRTPVRLTGSLGSVTALAFSRDGERIVSGGDDGVLRIWDWDPSRRPTLAGLAARPGRFLLTLDGRVVASDGRTGRKVSFSIDGQLRSLELVADPTSISLSRDGLRAAAPVDPVVSGSIQLWDLAQSSRPRTVPVSRRVNAVALSADGGSIAVGERGKVRVWQWPLSHERVLGQTASSDYTAVSFDVRGRRVAGAAYDGKTSTVSVWDLAAEREALSFSAPGFVHAIAFSHDGNRLAVADTDGAVRVWDLGGARTPVVLRGHAGAVNDVAFSPDDTELVSGGHDGTVRIWELTKGGQSVPFPGPGGPILEVAFTPNGGEVIASSTRDARIWTCDFCGSTGDVLANAKRIATRALTPEERALFLHES